MTRPPRPITGNAAAASKNTRGWDEGDFVLFGAGIAHSFRSEEQSPLLTVRRPSIPVPSGV